MLTKDLGNRRQSLALEINDVPLRGEGKTRPALYFGMSLGVTFPLNILAGIPLYAWLAQSALN
ncbi:sodium-dependent bicarbonate transport family permease [Hylemonella gracilis]|jgi:hypothetical protein|uniref:sodium-dependent bicarbonate transport family permease n=1 Tax=Hylemonella gracilis TaxID=80880 RepID=UPI0026D39751